MFSFIWGIELRKRQNIEVPTTCKEKRVQWDWGVGRETRGLILDKYDVYMHDIMTLIILYNEYMPVSKTKTTFISFGIQKNILPLSIMIELFFYKEVFSECFKAGTR